MLWVEFCVCELNVTQVLFKRIVPHYNRVAKSAVIGGNFQMLSYTQLLWTEKRVTSCSTSLVTLTWSHLQKRKKSKKKKNISYRVYIYLTNVKGFFLFMCESCESLFFNWFTVDMLFISFWVWMDVGLNRGTFPVYVKCACVWAWECACACVCRSVSLKQYEWEIICELKCLEI